MIKIYRNCEEALKVRLCEVVEFLGDTSLYVEFMTASDNPDVIGHVSEFVGLKALINVLNRRLKYMNFIPAYRRNKSAVEALLKHLTQYTQPTPEESRINELLKEIENLKSKIKKIEKRDYKNRALKASLTRTKKIVKLLTT